MATARKTTAQRTSAAKTAPAFTDEERSAMKERAKEVKAAKSGSVDGATAVLDKIAEMEERRPRPGRAGPRGRHGRGAGPRARLWYGMPAYAKDGKVLCFFQPATKFKSRYSTMGFNDPAALDDGAMWPCAYALTPSPPPTRRRSAR